MNPKSDKDGFIVVYPNGTGKYKDRFLNWNDGSQRSGSNGGDVDDVAFFRQLIVQLEKDYNVDPKRIYSTGLSNGAIMTYRLGCELSGTLAAIAPVSGALNYEKGGPAAPLSVIIFHGTEDRYVPYEGGVGKASGGRTRNDKSVAAAVDFWVKHNGCNPVPTRNEFGNIVKEQYAGGVADTEVVLYTIKGGGHSWPGGLNGVRNGNVDPPTQEISATDLIWEFFSKHTKK
jgi:polyhydroxybutyrate depolymerase